MFNNSLQTLLIAGGIYSVACSGISFANCNRHKKLTILLHLTAIIKRLQNVHLEMRQSVQLRNFSEIKVAEISGDIRLFLQFPCTTSSTFLISA